MPLCIRFLISQQDKIADVVIQCSLESLDLSCRVIMTDTSDKPPTTIDTSASTSTTHDSDVDMTPQESKTASAISAPDDQPNMEKPESTTLSSSSTFIHDGDLLPDVSLSPSRTPSPSPSPYPTDPSLIRVPSDEFNIDPALELLPMKDDGPTLETLEALLRKNGETTTTDTTTPATTTTPTIPTTDIAPTASTSTSTIDPSVKKEDITDTSIKAEDIKPTPEVVAHVDGNDADDEEEHPILSERDQRAALRKSRAQQPKPPKLPKSRKSQSKQPKQEPTQDTITPSADTTPTSTDNMETNDDEEDAEAEKLAREKRARAEALRAQSLREAALDDMIPTDIPLPKSLYEQNKQIRQALKQRLQQQHTFVSQHIDVFRPFLIPRVRKMYEDVKDEEDEEMQDQSLDVALQQEQMLIDGDTTTPTTRSPTNATSSTITPPLTTQPDCIINGELRPYQLDGVNWLISRHDQGAPGLLGDEMVSIHVVTIHPCYALSRGMYHGQHPCHSLSWHVSYHVLGSW